jgi:DNA-binding protein H-NS
MPLYWLCYRHNNQISVVIRVWVLHTCPNKLTCFTPKITEYTVFVLEITMPKINLSGMTVETLMDLRKRVDEALHKRRAELERQLVKMGSAVAVIGGRGKSALKGRKVPLRYRGPSGETWAGRGARPLWLVAAIKGGKKLDDFLIDKSARKQRKKRGLKR